MIMLSLLCISSTIIPLDYIHYNTLIYRSKITARMILQKDTEDIYNSLTRLQLYSHPVYLFSLYSDFNEISMSFNTFTLFDDFFKDLSDIPDLKYDSTIQKIVKYDYHCFKTELLFNKLKNKKAHVKTLDLYFCLKMKFSTLLDFKINIPEIHNILFYTFSLLKLFDENRIIQLLLKFALIYTVISKLQPYEVISMECVYFLLGNIIDTLMPFSQCGISFQYLKSKIMEESNLDIHFPSQFVNSELALLRNFGVIFLMEKYIENRFKNSSSPFSRLYTRFSDTEVIEIYSNLEKLISFFYSQN